MANWGDTSDGDQDVALLNHVRLSSGQFSPGAGSWQLDSLFVRGGANPGAGRVSVYRNSVHDVDGATLVEDLGTVSLPSNAWVEKVSVSNPVLTDGDYLFLGVKGTNTNCNVRSNPSNPEDLITYWDAPSGESADETVAWGASLGAESFTNAQPISIYIVYSAVPTGPTDVVVTTYFNDIQG